jgi:ferredoxin-nitrite reductase
MLFNNAFARHISGKNYIIEVPHSMNDEEKAAVTLRLPSTLSAYSGGKSQIQVRADTVAQLLAVLQQIHPLVWERLCTGDGHVREHVKIFVNNVMITGPNGLQTPLKPGQEIIVLPVTSGV